MELRELIDLHNASIAKAHEWLDDPYAGGDARATYQQTIEVHAETARILAVMERVQRECMVVPTFDVDTGEQSLEILGPATALRALAAVLTKREVNSNG